MKTTEYLVFDPSNPDPKTLKLSDIADEIRYIQIEKKYNIGYLSGLRVYPEYIFLNAKDIGVVRYNREGRDGTLIGKIGRGPGEYPIVRSYTFNACRDEIYILSSGSEILVYKTDGKFDRSIPLKSFNNSFDEIDMLGENILLSEYIIYGNAVYNWIILNTDGNILSQKKNPVPAFKNRAAINGGTCEYRNSILYWNIYNDTVYRIHNNMKYDIGFMIGNGDFRIKTIEYDHEKMKKSLGIMQILETSQYYYLYYAFKNAFIGILDKQTRVLYNSKVMVSFENNSLVKSGGIINDIDQTIDFIPVTSFFDKSEYLVGWVYPEMLKANNETKSIDLKDIDPMGNPVLMIVRLKGNP